MCKFHISLYCCRPADQQLEKGLNKQKKQQLPLNSNSLQLCHATQPMTNFTAQIPACMHMVQHTHTRCMFSTFVFRQKLLAATDLSLIMTVLQSLSNLQLPHGTRVTSDELLFRQGMVSAAVLQQFLQGPLVATGQGGLCHRQPCGSATACESHGQLRQQNSMLSSSWAQS